MVAACRCLPAYLPTYSCRRGCPCRAEQRLKRSLSTAACAPMFMAPLSASRPKRGSQHASMPASEPTPNVSCRVRVGAEAAPGPEVWTSHHSARTIANAFSPVDRETPRCRTDRCSRLFHSRHFPSRTCDVDCMRAPACSALPHWLSRHASRPIWRPRAQAEWGGARASDMQTRNFALHTFTRSSHGHFHG